MKNLKSGEPDSQNLTFVQFHIHVNAALVPTGGTEPGSGAGPGNPPQSDAVTTRERKRTCGWRKRRMKRSSCLGLLCLQDRRMQAEQRMENGRSSEYPDVADCDVIKENVTMRNA